MTDSTREIDFDGTYIVKTDLPPQTWKGPRWDSCYMARLSGFGGSNSELIASELIANGLPSGPAIVTIASTDKGFRASRCAIWRLLTTVECGPLMGVSDDTLRRCLRPMSTLDAWPKLVN